MFVKPGEGRVVHDPERGEDLPAEGRSVPRTAYWVRAVNSGDVVIVESDGAVGTAKPAVKAAAKPARAEGESQ
ncbi:DUF2635 domain-containing protein [Herbaspirillum rubrisubalbicans Os34]|uniref:DUF2635 domain-containing protein n=1 Tax=Herbaspirillum rubrisubalbicans Os34 TaxID=1235827 RepID=A0A6M3ZTY5_9BURK|nr:DUF2635 domain-containing protein [Herbaspirillum rubrisubalbicans]QJQ02109.1 DUF2635 domain-containing protein [Herbaspirillum rubrisubalbicans Os34]